MFELHMKWFNYISPWWESAKKDPATHLKEIHDYINNNLTDKIKELKLLQIKKGITAGYDEIMKMSNVLFAPPIIFLILIDPCQRCSFCRALLTFICNHTNKFTAYESYKEFPFIEGHNWPEDEKRWYKLLSSYDHTTVCSHFVTMGLHQDIVANDLLNIGQANDLVLQEGEVLPEKIVTTFSQEFEVLFHALKAVFWQMPSSSLIAEQKAGTLREMMYKGISQGMIDVASNFHTNINHKLRQKRRDSERKRQAVKLSSTNESSGSMRKQQIGHDKNKLQQQQLGEDVLEDSTRYSPERVKTLPKHVLIKASIRSISTRGFRYIENDITKAKMKQALAQKSNPRIKTLSFTDYQDIANNLVVDNDITFKYLSPQEIERRNDVERYSQYGIWNSLRVMDGFREQLKEVLVGFWCNEMETVSKSKILIQLDKYLKLIQNISDLKVVRVRADNSSDFTSDEIDSLDKIGRLSKFVTPSKYLSDMRQSKKRKIDTIKDVSAYFSIF